MTFDVLSPALYVLGVCSVVSSGQNHRTPHRSFVPWRDCSLLSWLPQDRKSRLTYDFLTDNVDERMNSYHLPPLP